MKMKHQPGQCKISMLWNWYTIDSCFIARSWHNDTKGKFAGSCIGVFFLVVAQQWLIRFVAEYDRALQQRAGGFESCDNDSGSKDSDPACHAAPTVTRNPLAHLVSHSWYSTDQGVKLWEQALRAFLATVNWGVSYIIMLLFMYYNGYIIISCLIGALVGKFLFSDLYTVQPKCCM